MRENILYLLLSVTLSAGRNVLSKKTALHSGSKSDFFLLQTVLFTSAALLLTVFGIKDAYSLSSVTALYGLIYGLLLVLSQWTYTAALSAGDASVCSVVYSLGFILPTVSGAIFWDEEFTYRSLAGLITALSAIMLTAKKDTRANTHGKAFIPCIVTAMLASGGLGIMQKVQQSSAVSDQKSLFLIIAFVTAAVCSLTAMLICGPPRRTDVVKIASPCLAGLCFGGANLCNTVLAGRMKSAVFFPLQNISTILLSTFLGIIFFKERLTVKTVFIILLGAGAVIIFSI